MNLKGIKVQEKIRKSTKIVAMYQVDIKSGFGVSAFAVLKLPLRTLLMVSLPPHHSPGWYL
jgi:hypothetical protein